MRNCQISDIKDDVRDRLAGLVTKGRLSPSTREIILSDTRISQLITQAFRLFCVQAEPSVLNQMTDLVTMTLTDYGTLGTAYLPENRFAPRGDGGIVGLQIDSKEFDIGSSVPFQTVKQASGSVLYGRSVPMFHINVDNKRVYVPREVTLKLRIIRNPVRVASADEVLNTGVLLTITGGVSSTGNLTLGDGTQNISVPVTSGDTEEQVAVKILAAITSTTVFNYSLTRSGAAITLIQKYNLDAGTELAVTLGAAGTGVTSTIADQGTLELPVLDTPYREELVRLTMVEIYRLIADGQPEAQTEEVNE